jgi:hypothetical protein
MLYLEVGSSKEIGREFQEYIAAHCLLCSNEFMNSSVSFFNCSIVNDVSENDNFCLSPHTVVLRSSY